MFKLALTFKNPSGPAGSQQGFPAPGSGAQTTGDPVTSAGRATPWAPLRPIKGGRSWFGVTAGGENTQRGFAQVGAGGQIRPKGSMPNKPPVYGDSIPVWTPYYDRGAAAYVQNYGKVLYNPIGAGIAVNHRPSASYGPSAEYINGQIWWTSQAVPTSVGLQGLTSPAVLQALLSRMSVQAVVREP